MEFFEDDSGVSGDAAVRIYCTPEAILAYDQWVTYPMKSMYETDTFTTVTSVMRAFANDHLGDVEFPLRDFSVRITTPNQDEDDDFFVSVDPRNRDGWYAELTRQVSEALGVQAVSLADEDNTPVDPENITHVIAHHGDRFVATETTATTQVVAVKIDARITSSMPVDEQMRVYATELAQRIYDTNDKEALRQYIQDPHFAYNIAVAVSKQCGLDAVLRVSFGCHRKTFYERTASFVRAHVRNTVDALSSTKVSPTHLIRSFTKEFRDVSFAGWIQSAISPQVPAEEEEESSASEEDELVGTSIDCEYTTYSSDDEAPIAANALLRTFKNVAKRSKYVSFKLERAIQNEKPKDFSWTGTTALEPGDIIHTFLHAATETKRFSLRKKQEKPRPTSVIIDIQMRNRRDPSAEWLVVFTAEMLLPTKGTSPGILFTVPLDDSLYRVQISLRRPGNASLMTDVKGGYEFTVDPMGTKAQRNYPVTWEQIKNARYNQELRKEYFIPEFTFHARLPTLAPFPYRSKKIGEIIDYFPPDQPQVLEDERQRTLAEQRSIGVDGFVKHIAEIVKYKSYAINEVRAVIWTHANNRRPYMSSFLEEALQEYDSEYSNVPLIGVNWNEDFSGEFGSGDTVPDSPPRARAASSVPVSPPQRKPQTTTLSSVNWNEDFNNEFGNGDTADFGMDVGVVPDSPPRARTAPSTAARPKLDWNEDFSGEFGKGGSDVDFGMDYPPRATPPKKPKAPVSSVDWNEDFSGEFGSGSSDVDFGLGAKAPQTIGGRTVTVPPAVWSGVIDGKSASAFAMDPSRALSGGRSFAPVPIQPISTMRTSVVRQQPRVTITPPQQTQSAPTSIIPPTSTIPAHILALDEYGLNSDINRWLSSASGIYDIVLVNPEITYEQGTVDIANNLKTDVNQYTTILQAINQIQDDAARIDSLQVLYQQVEQVVGVTLDSLALQIRAEMLQWINQVVTNIEAMRDAPTTPAEKKSDFEDLITAVRKEESTFGADTIPPEATMKAIARFEDRARSLNGSFNVPTPAASSGAASSSGDQGTTASRISVSAFFNQLNAEQQSVGENVIDRTIDEAVSYVALAGASVTHGFDRILNAVFRRNDPKYFGGVFRSGKRYLTVIPDKVRWDEILESIRNEQTEYVDFVNNYTFEITPGTLFSHSRPVEVVSLNKAHAIKLKRTYSKTNNTTVIQLFDRSGTYFGTMDTNVFTESYKIHTVKMDGWMGFSS